MKNTDSKSASKKYYYIVGYLLLIIVVWKFITFFTESSQLRLPTQNTVQISAPDEKTEGRVTKVIDGDTVRISINGSEQSVRLIGIDAPERKSCYYEESKQILENFLGSNEVFLEQDFTQGDRDKYNRLLRYIFVADGTNINKKMLEVGGAKEYTYNLSYKYVQEFIEAQDAARNSMTGLWGNCPK